MRIAFLNPSGALGGAERSLLDVFAGLRQTRPGWDLRLVCADDGPFVKEARALGIQAEVLPFPEALSRLGDAGVGGAAGQAGLLLRLAWAAPGISAYIRRLAVRLDAVAPDILDCSGFKMHVLGARARPRGAAVIWHVHDFVGSRPFMSRLLRAHARPDIVSVANSRSVAEDLRRACPGSGEVIPVYYGIDLERFSPSGPVLDLDEASGLPAAFALWKGHEVFLKALSMLPRELPVRGYVIGGGIYATRTSQHALDGLKRTSERLALRDRVGFTGFVRDPAEAMRALDVVVHASTAPEPFGRVIVEAMACGRAVVASPLGGAAELIVDGTDALSHAPGDAADLSAVLARLAREPRLRASLGAAGRQKARARFAKARMISDLVPIYESLAPRVVAVHA